MTGCPNNCARPPTAEIGIFGYGKNDHVILVGGSREGTRLAHVLYARISGRAAWCAALVGLLAARSASATRRALPAGELLHRTPPEQLREWVGVADDRPGGARDRPSSVAACSRLRRELRAPGEDRSPRGSVLSPSSLQAMLDAAARPSVGRAARSTTGRLERAPGRSSSAASLAEPLVRDAVLEGALESKRRGKGDLVSFSRNVFIPLTNLCRDRCDYCTFAKRPDAPGAKTYTLAEVAEVARGGVRAGCIEALFCLGDKPELAYREHREWLAQRGLPTHRRVPRAGVRRRVRGAACCRTPTPASCAARRWRGCGAGTRRWG